MKLLALLNRDGKLDLDVVVIDSTMVPAPGGGGDTGPNPTDRAKSGTKHTLLVDSNGVPLALHTTGANASDQQQLETIIHKFPTSRANRDAPKNTPRPPWRIEAMTAKPTACCCVGWESNRSSPSVAPNTVPVLASSDG